MHFESKSVDWLEKKNNHLAIKHGSAPVMLWACVAGRLRISLVEEWTDSVNQQVVLEANITQSVKT